MTSSDLTLKEALQKAYKSLQNIVDDPQREALAIMATVFHMQRDSQVLSLSQSHTLDPEATMRFELLLKRRSRGEPMAYLRGYEVFYGRKFQVDRRVLIPRPETEFLVEEILKLSDYLKEKPILDLCTGSGVIAISLQLELASQAKNHLILASDISSDALHLAKENSKNLGAPVSFIQADLLDFPRDKSLGVIVCNPPYVPEEYKSQMQIDVLDFEPHLALFSRENGLYHPRIVIEKASRVLCKGGYLFMECGIDQSKTLIDTGFSSGFTLIRVKSDYGGVERILIFQKEE